MSKKDKRVAVKATVRLAAYRIVDDAVTRGIRFGIARAHKHTPRPSPEALEDAIEAEVMNALCDAMEFDA